MSRRLPKPGAKAAAEAMVNTNVSGTFDQDVAAEVERLRILQTAQDVLKAERIGPAPEFDLGTLTEVLARPPGPVHRVDGLIPADAGTLVVAQRKAGKSTLTLNLARSLLTGEKFLGTFDVVPVAGTVALLNFEVSAQQLARWGDEVGVPATRLVLVNLRNRRNPLSNNADREQLAAQLRQHEVESLMVDPFGRAFTGTSQNDAGEVGAFLGDLDRWCRGDVGARDVVLTTHAGWDGERSRGASALEDWPDSIITMTRGTGEREGDRYLRAEGRDVLVEEDRLDFDPRTRLLTMAGTGSRRDTTKAAKVDDLVPHVVKVVRANPDINGTQVGHKLREAGVPFTNGEENRALSLAAGRGDLLTRMGSRNAKHYTVPPPPPTSPDLPQQGSKRPPPTPLYRGRS